MPAETVPVFDNTGASFAIFSIVALEQCFVAGYDVDLAAFVVTGAQSRRQASTGWARAACTLNTMRTGTVPRGTLYARRVTQRFAHNHFRHRRKAIANAARQLY